MYYKGSCQPVVLADPFFNQDVFPTAGEDTVFCHDKAFDLNNKTSRILDCMRDKLVVAKYGDSFIIADTSMLYGFEKIPAEQLLN